MGTQVLKTENTEEELEEAVEGVYTMLLSLSGEGTGTRNVLEITRLSVDKKYILLT